MIITTQALARFIAVYMLLIAKSLKTDMHMCHVESSYWLQPLHGWSMDGIDFSLQACVDFCIAPRSSQTRSASSSSPL
jgi:hypothetical protein